MHLGEFKLFHIMSSFDSPKKSCVSFHITNFEDMKFFQIYVFGELLFGDMELHRFPYHNVLRISILLISFLGAYFYLVCGSGTNLTLPCLPFMHIYHQTN